MLIEFVFGPFTIYSYGFFISLAVFAGFLLANRRAKKFGLSFDDLLNLFLICTPLAIAGARLYHVFSELSYYCEHPFQIFSFWQGGLGIFGAIAGGLVGIFVYTKYKHLDFYKILNLLTPSLVLGQGIGRWGNILNGELLPYAIYESILDFSVFLLLTFNFFRQRQTSPWLALLTFSARGGPALGWHFPIYAILYGAGRFFLEFLRTEPAVFGFLKLNQIVSLMLVVSGVLILKRKSNENLE